ncbi:hypothetical protein C1645_733829 [Glomus cerebriforme]|uniref:DUF8211 domain-containing protein n=1 Tax=Glomus cerebriforme TaxID=658196 RepID=A0A397TGY1_9GLOM|nr:hypothetical protein C1645_733829 [Glomus cerebriforme]
MAPATYRPPWLCPIIEQDAFCIKTPYTRTPHHMTYRPKLNRLLPLNTYNKWKNKTPNPVFSNRLGISYTTQIKTISEKNGYSPTATQIYSKEYANYTIGVRSNNTPFTLRTLIKQEIRRNRALRRIISHENRLSDAKDHSMHDERSWISFLAWKYRTLIDPSHNFFKRIDHIKFSKLKHKPVKSFPLPPKWHYDRCNSNPTPTTAEQAYANWLNNHDGMTLNSRQ